MDREHEIRERAYAIWEADGRPSDRDQDHWDRAAREVDEQRTAKPADVQGSSATPSPAPPEDEPTQAASATAPARAPRAAKPKAKPATSRTGKSKSSKTSA